MRLYIVTLLILLICLLQHAKCRLDEAKAEIKIQFSRLVVSNSFRPHGLQHASLSITNFWSLLKLKSIGSVMPPNHPLSSPSPPAFNLSQHQGLLKRVSFLHQVAKVSQLQLQHQAFQLIFRPDFL